MAAWDQALQNRIGPPWDAVCGDDGLSTDLNAVWAAGHRRILLAEGAILTAGLGLNTAGAWIWSPFHPLALNLGAFTLTVNAAYMVLAGFSIQGAAGTGFACQQNADELFLERIGAVSCGVHGIHLNNDHDDHVLDRVICRGNTADGIRTKAGALNVRIINSEMTGNTGFGVNDLDDSSILVGNKINGNTAGQINGTPAIDVGNLKT